MSFRQFSAVRTLKGKSDWRDKKCRFSVTKASAPVYSAYAAIKASAGLSPLYSYSPTNSYGTTKSSSIKVNLLMRRINSLNASGVRLLRTSITTKRGILMNTTSDSLAITSMSFSQVLSLSAPRAKRYSLLSRMSSKFLLPKFFSGFAYFFNYFLFTHTSVRGFYLIHELTYFSYMQYGLFCSFHSNHLYAKDIIFNQRRQAPIGI